MGADIYLYSEIERDGIWEFVGETEENAHHDPEENPASPPRKPVELYGGRDYHLFDILGGLQRSSSYILDGQLFEMIAERRGLPADLSPELRAWHRERESDDVYGENWLLLSEILSFDWHGKFMRFEAMVDARVASLFHPDQPFPRAQWPADIPIGYAAFLRDGVKVRWTDSYAASVDSSIFALFERLTKLGDPTQTRLIFWFDC